MYEMTWWFAETTGQSIENETSVDGMQATVTVSCNHFVISTTCKKVVSKHWKCTPYIADGSAGHAAR